VSRVNAAVQGRQRCRQCAAATAEGEAEIAEEPGRRWPPRQAVAVRGGDSKR